MARTTFVILAALAVAPLAAEGQPSSSPASRIEAARARIARADIPVGLIEVKVAEGRSKGVPEERIAAAVERRAAALLRAQVAMAPSGRRIGTAELSAGADALEQGADAASLRAVLERAPPGQGAVALAVLGLLTAEGVPVARAVVMVQQAIARGGDALTHLPAQATGRGRAPPSRTGGRPDGAGGAPPGVPKGRPRERPPGKPTSTPGTPP